MDEQLTFEFAERPTIKGFPELRWTGKRPYRSTQYYPAQLRERYGEEMNGWINKIFWGDNLQVMSHMLKEYRGKIDLVYIDPPFDSKADYKKKIEVKGIGKAETDSTSFEEKQYGDIWTNDEYLQFIYERLVILRELLSEKGCLYFHCNGVQREHNKKLNNGLPILHKVPPKRDYGRYFCIMAEKGGTSHGGLTEKLSPFFHAKKQEVNAYGR